MGNEGKKFLRDLAIVGGVLAAGNGVYEMSGEKARIAQEKVDKMEFYKHHGLLDAKGKIDKEKLDEWRRDSGLYYIDGDIEKYNHPKFMEMLRDFANQKAIKKAKELPDIPLDKSKAK